MKNKKKNNKLDEFIHSISWLSIIVTLLLSFLLTIIISYPVDFLKDIGLLFVKFSFTFIISLIVVHLPIYHLDKIDNLVTNSISRIDQCPRLTAFYTEKGILNKKLDEIDKLEPNQRWMMSKFISELLSSNFASFTVKMDTLQYSLFSIKIIKECKESVHLTGSMRPSTWLNGLVDKRDTEKFNQKNDFFNHLLPPKVDFPINKENHSVFISECDSIKDRQRIVCLTPEDMKYLFISEKSVDAYFKINHQKDGIHTYFIEWNKSDSCKMDPLKYEYALYDNGLLFKYNKKTKKLTIINGAGSETQEKIDEFDEVVKFFEDNLKDNSRKVDYDQIKTRIGAAKMDLLLYINKENRLLHKYSYLYSGGKRWSDYLKRESLKYGLPATTSIAELLDLAFAKQRKKDNGPLDIVEIGPGEGGRITTVCDCLGTTDIASYTLIDISKRLLNQSEYVLKKRLLDLTTSVNDEPGEPDEPKTKCHTIELDCCSDETETKNRFNDAIKGKTVLILSNSTLFTEPHFPWDSLKSAKQTFITLDLYDANCKPYEDLTHAWPLFLLPLKVFEIPIIDEVIEKLSKYLFIDNSQDYDNPNNCIYNIFFNLKAYLQVLAHKNISGNEVEPKDIAEAIVVKSHQFDKESIIKDIEELWDKEFKEPVFDYNNVIESKKKEYKNERAKLLEKDKLMVLSCLKFKKRDDSQLLENDVITYFEDKGICKNKGFDVKVIGLKNTNEKFIGILIKQNKKRNNK